MSSNLRSSMIPKLLKFIKLLVFLFLIIHLGLGVSMLFNKLNIISFFEIPSVLFYTFLCYHLGLSSEHEESLVLSIKLSRVITAIVIELTIHMLLAMYFCGLDFQFQLYICMLLWYSSCLRIILLVIAIKQSLRYLQF